MIVSIVALATARNLRDYNHSPRW